ALASDGSARLTSTTIVPLFLKMHNARLRGWQRMPLNSNTTTATTAAQWDWKRHALAVPLEAFVSRFFSNLLFRKH
ncbi:hypothetical protein, partial [Vibrio cincinnatiensis]|uniref:hypothetical protein n=1 Tax=Vibrio cincinnatiensis TaxID=675 RepID=UPI001EDC93C4